MSDDAADINKAIDDLYDRYGGGYIHLDARVYTLTSSIIGRDNITIIGAFCGAHLFDTTVTCGTILRWEGANGVAVVYQGPGHKDYKIDNCGLSDLTIDGAGKAGIGVQCMSAYYGRYARVHVMNVKTYAYYFGTLPTDIPSPNYHCRLDDLTACLPGSASGIVCDGTPGSGRNTCFLSARNCHVTHQNGVAYALSNADDCSFLDCANSRIAGGNGGGIYFGGSSEPTAKAAYGNRFIGWKGNAPISAAGGTFPSRGNYVLTNAVDGLPEIYQGNGSTLTVDIYDGEVTFNGLARNPLRAG